MVHDVDLGSRRPGVLHVTRKGVEDLTQISPPVWSLIASWASMAGTDDPISVTTTSNSTANHDHSVCAMREERGEGEEKEGGNGGDERKGKKREDVRS